MEPDKLKITLFACRYFFILEKKSELIMHNEGLGQSVQEIALEMS